MRTDDTEDEADRELEAELDEDDFGGADLPPPPPPPAPGAERKPPRPPPPELLEIGRKITRATDPLERQALVHAALCESIADVLADTEITPAERRKELRTIAAAAAKLFPYRRLYEAEQTVKQARAELEARKRNRAGATLEKRKAAGKIIPIRGSAVPGASGGKP